MERVKTKEKGVYTRTLTDGDIAYDITYRDGHRVIFETVGKKSAGWSVKLAALKRAEKVGKLASGEPIPDKRQRNATLSECADAYFAWAKVNRKAMGEAEESRWRNHLEPRFGKMRVRDITERDIDDLKEALFKRELAPKSIAHVLTTARTLVNHGISRKIYSGVNPFTKIELPDYDNQRQRFLTAEEIKALLAELKRRKMDQVHDLALLSVYTGCRAGEAFGLRAGDVNFDAGFVSFTDTKNGDVRHIPMSGPAREMLAERVKTAKGPAELLFKSTKNDQIAELSHAFGRACKKLFNEGVKDRRFKVTFHTLRHSFASHLALQGESLYTLADLLGHRTLQMVKRYSHLTHGHRQKAVNGLEAALNGKSKIVEIKAEG
jgi:site-specific recombinase XerD